MKSLYVGFLSLTLVFGFNNPCLSQRQSNIWFFGERAGFSFHNNAPTPLTGNQMVSYGSTTIASSRNTGKVLFYSNGEQVWNGLHALMPNGSGLSGSRYSTTNAYTVPFASNSNKYYLFTVNRANFSTEEGASIHYSIIDMSLNAGLGDLPLLDKNILLLENATEKIAATPHANGVDFWLITHDFNNNNFLVYHITETGISTPAIYSLGEPHSINPIGGQSIIEAQGHMKFSPDGNKLAVTLRSGSATPKPFQVFDFNTQTGELSNAVTLGNFSLQYGVSFSTNSRMLYLQGYSIDGNTFDYLYQFDMSAQNIDESRVGLLINNPFLDRIQFGGGFASFDLQLGADGRLYSAGSPTSGDDQHSRRSMFVINAPNEKGYTCNVTVNQYNFIDGKVNIGLPNFLQSDFIELTPDANPNAPCPKSVFELYPNPVSDYLTIKNNGDCTNIFRLTMFDALGRFILLEEIYEHENIFNLSNLSSGMYLLKIESQQTSFVQKIIKK